MPCPCPAALLALQAAPAGAQTLATACEGRLRLGSMMQRGNGVALDLRNYSASWVSVTVRLTQTAAGFQPDGLVVAGRRTAVAAFHTEPLHLGQPVGAKAPGLLQRLAAALDAQCMWQGAA